MKLSIITINLNNASDLKNTICSVLAQKFSDFEYIVIDGGSSDGSVEVIKQYEQQISYWISEPDSGIFNALNKGVMKSKGDYLLMLNAGDILYNDGVLNNIFDNINDEDILYGNVILESKGEIFGEKVFNQQITFDFFRRTSISHQGTFIKRSLHDVVGLYDENLKFSSDWKFFVLAFCKYNVSAKYVNFFIAVCNCDGLTWSNKNFPSMKLEMNGVLNEHFPAFIADYDMYDKLRNRSNLFRRKYLEFKIQLKGVARKYIRGN